MTTVELYTLEDVEITLSDARELADELSERLDVDIRASEHRGCLTIEIAKPDWDAMTEKRAHDFINGYLFAKEL